MHSNATTPSARGGLGRSERAVLNHLASLERATVRASDVLAALSAGRASVNLTLSRLARKGWLRRLRRGVYAVVPLSSRSGEEPVDDPLAVAMQLFAPCYISGWSAAQHWGLTDQIFNAVVVYSARPQRRGTQVVAGTTYRVRRVRNEAIFGTARVWSGPAAIQMADVHRTVIDVLDAPDLGGGGRHTLDIVRSYWARSEADPKRLLEYAQRLGRGTVFKRLGFTAERAGKVDAGWLRLCQDHLSAGVSLLDPAGLPRGPIISRWRLRVNIPTEQMP